MWGYVGEIDEDTDVINALRHPSQLFSKRHLIYTHLHFSIGYNADQIVQVNISTNPNERQDLSDKSLTFSYSVEWVPSTLEYKDRMLRYASNSFLPAALEIHWLSIINSFVLVLLLTAFLTIILMRILKNDFARYMAVEMGEEAGEAEGKESGWKLLRGDVFRFPPYVGLLAACVGNGVQLFVLCFCLLSVSLLGTFGPHKRGAVVTALIILYALTSGVSGFVSAQLYKKLNGQTWVWNIVGSAVLFPSVVSACFIFLNSTAWAHGSTAALPFGTIVIIILLYLLVALPLSIIGGIAGRNTTGALEPPCRTNFNAKELPEVPWCVPARVSLSFSLSISLALALALALALSLSFARALPPYIHGSVSMPARLSTLCRPHPHPRPTRLLVAGTATWSPRALWPGFCRSPPFTSSCAICLRRCGGTRSTPSSAFFLLHSSCSSSSHRSLRSR